MSMVEPGSLASEGTGDITPEPSSSGGGFKSWPKRKQYLAIGGGVGGLVIVYLFAKSRKAKTTASSAQNTANTSASGTTPTLVLPSSNQDSVSGTNYSALSGGLDNLSNQVSQINSQGATPVTPPVSVPTQPKPTPVSTPPAGIGSPPNVSSSILNGIPGQTVVSEKYDPATKGWLALSNKGGIFALDSSGNPGPGFYGSPLGDPGTDGWIGPNGTWQRTAQQLTIRPSGGYTITDTAGENYSYGPG